MKSPGTPRSVLLASAASVAAVLLTAGPAYADLWGGDLPLLGGILATLGDTVAKASETISTLKKTFDETKRVVGFAEDAAAAYQHFSHYSAAMFSADLRGQLDAAFPDIAYLRTQASNTGAWTHGTGELQRLLVLCLTGVKVSCLQVQQVMTYQETRDALSKTFGTAPQGASSMLAIDHEAAQAIRSGQAQAGKSARDRSYSDAWMKSCANADATDKDNLAACQAAGASAQIQALTTTADVADQVAEGNRLAALQLEQANESRKQELLEAAERHQILLDGVESAAPRPGLVTADGYNLLSGFGQ